MVVFLGPVLVGRREDSLNSTEFRPTCQICPAWATPGETQLGDFYADAAESAADP